MDHDVIIVGGGPAGLSLAVALRASGLDIALVERAPAAALAAPAFDGREIALTQRSIRILDALGAWSLIPAGEVSPLRKARVLNGASPFALGFDPRARGTELGKLVSNHLIRAALFERAAAQPNLALLAGLGVTSAATDPRGAAIALSDGRRLRARLLVAADSRFSAVRDWLGIGAAIKRLGKSMLTCRVTHEAEHGQVATEWFDHGQTIALLPLGGRMSSMILTLGSGEIERIAALDEAALGAELTRRSAGRLGAMTPVGRPHAYPLAITWSRHFAADRAALIGDAAVGMHPVTAHGFNLGLLSQDRLARLVTAAAAQGGDIAAPSLLRRYEAGHRRASWPIYAATNAIVRLYTGETPPARLARHVGLRLAARLPLFRGAVGGMLMQR